MGQRSERITMVLSCSSLLLILSVTLSLSIFYKASAQPASVDSGVDQSDPWLSHYWIPEIEEGVLLSENVKEDEANLAKLGWHLFRSKMIRDTSNSSSTSLNLDSTNKSDPSESTQWDQIPVRSNGNEPNPSRDNTTLWSLPGANNSNSDPPFNGSIWYNDDTLYRESLNLKDAAKFLYCACNCSYISYSCCNARDGIVHESPDNNRGVLDQCKSEEFGIVDSKSFVLNGSRPFTIKGFNTSDYNS